MLISTTAEVFFVANVNFIFLILLLLIIATQCQEGTLKKYAGYGS